jgi:histidinol-phosphate/aromatic aminotransferase/cobyric acid decarboxylase-like protein
LAGAQVKDSYNVNALTQAVGTAALRDREHLTDLVAKTLAQRAAVCAALAEFGWTWPPTEANFVLAEVGSIELAGRIYDGLKARGILIRCGCRLRVRCACSCREGEHVCLSLWVGLRARARSLSRQAHCHMV